MSDIGRVSRFSTSLLATMNFAPPGMTRRNDCASSNWTMPLMVAPLLSLKTLS